MENFRKFATFLQGIKAINIKNNKRLTQGSLKCLQWINKKQI